MAPLEKADIEETRHALAMRSMCQYKGYIDLNGRFFYGVRINNLDIRYSCGYDLMSDGRWRRSRRFELFEVIELTIEAAHG